MKKKQTNQQVPNFETLFKESLVKWGGWEKFVTGDATGYGNPISNSISTLSQHQQKSPARIGKLTPEEWVPISKTLPVFLNAYLQQELSRILDGPGDVLDALRLVDNNLVGQLLMALIIVAREHHLHVEVSYKNPYSSAIEDCKCHLSCGYRLATLAIWVGKEYAEEHLPLVLHYHGEDFVFDEEESTPEKPVWEQIAVDRKGVIFTDGLEFREATLQQRNRDEFLREQGFQSMRFSAFQIQQNLFGCAAEAVKMISGKTLQTQQGDAK